MSAVVALRKESVDRNIPLPMPLPRVSVALRKESVDRNLYYGDDLTFSDGSLSARRAWIEICYLDNIEITQASRSPQGERG